MKPVLKNNKKYSVLFCLALLICIPACKDSDKTTYQVSRVVHKEVVEQPVQQTYVKKEKKRKKARHKQMNNNAVQSTQTLEVVEQEVITK